MRRLLLLSTALLAAVAALLGLSASAGARMPAAILTNGPVVLVGTTGVDWSQVDPATTPHLWRMLTEGASGSLTVVSRYPTTCPVDGWLGLSAGGRAAAPRAAGGACPPIPPVLNGRVTMWSALADAASADRSGVALGTLGERLTSAGGCVRAIGPGAALAAADRDGRVTDWMPWPTSGAPDLTGCKAVLVDLGSAGGSQAIDQRLARVLAAAPPESDVLVASLAQGPGAPGLQLVAGLGPSLPAGTLWSGSTRQPGLVQVPDLVRTVLAFAQVTPVEGLGGAQLRVDPTAADSGASVADRLRVVRDLEQSSLTVQPLVEPFFTALGWAQLLLFGGALWWWRRGRGSAPARDRVLALLRVAGVWAGSVPAASFLAQLVPWWRLDVGAGPAVWGLTAAIAAGLAAIALLGPWRRSAAGPAAAVAGLTVLVLTVDAMTGSRLQQASLMGLQPLVGGRFFGFGNPTFGVFGTASVLFATAVAGWLSVRGRGRTALLSVLAIGLAALIVDAAPAWGADGGGPLSLLPAFAWLALAVAGLRVTLGRLVLVGVAAAVAFALVAGLDWLRPADDRTHLGGFVQAVLDGRALDIVSRKAAQNLSTLADLLPVSALVPLGLVVAWLLLARRSSWVSRVVTRAASEGGVPHLRDGLMALLVLWTLGFLANDTGTSIPSSGAAVALGLVVSVLVSARRRGAAERPRG